MVGEESDNMSPIRIRERVLVMLVLATFGFVSFIAVFYLPDKTPDTGNANKVYKVYKELENAGRDLIIPNRAPESPALEAPSVLHGHGGEPGAPDIHKVEDKAKLLAQVELDQEIQEMHRRQMDQMQQLPKPNMKPPSPPKEVSSSSSDLALAPFKKDNEMPADSPVITGGEDPSVLEKRETVRQVSKKPIAQHSNDIIGQFRSS